jgi:DNA-binding beta-propeller fold protein YncE
VCAATTGGYVTVHSTTDRSLLARVDVGAEPTWVMVDKDGSRAFVPCRADDVVSVIDLRGEPHEIARIETGRYPGRMVHWRTEIR